ncbi:MAG: transporter substrate-binding domain-containing protein [Negativicutes bacterium]|nr:transporter substrate-binding domain-containing protein [Negativicutes bacterium]
MRRTAIIALLFTLLVLLAACSSDKPSTARPAAPPGDAPAEPSRSAKVLLVTGEYAPYTTEALPDKGFFTQIVTAVFQEMGLECEIRFYPWARCEEMVKSGEAWAAFPYGLSEKTLQTYQVSAKVYPSRHKYFYLKNNGRLSDQGQDFERISDFKDFTVGGANGYWYGSKDDLKKLGIDRVEWAYDADGLVRMLYNQRIDVFIEDELVGWEAIKRSYPNETGKFATLPNDAQQREYFLIVSKTYPQSADLLNRFNAALGRVKDRGTLAAIVKSRAKD